MKKILCLAGVLMTAMMSSAMVITENFDWGTGVAGRESITAGTTINNGAVSGSAETWGVYGSLSSNAAAVFSGTSGIGNGKLTLTGTNTILRTAYTANWGSDVVTATATGTYTPSASGTRRFALGFQDASIPEGTLLGAGVYDQIVGDISNTGTIVFRVRFNVGGTSVNYDAVPNNFASFTSGDTVTHVMTIDGANSIATLLTTTSLGTVTNTVNYSAAGRALNLGEFCVTSRTSSVLVLDSVSVIPEPATVGMLGLGALVTLLVRRWRTR